MEAALVESETARRLEEFVAARVAEVVASDAGAAVAQNAARPRAQGGHLALTKLSVTATPHNCLLP